MNRRLHVSYFLSPQTSQEKISHSINSTLSIATNPEECIKRVLNNPLRNSLIERIKEIKELHIQEIRIPEENTIKERFTEIVGHFKPRNQRDIKHIISIMKAVAIINPYEKMVNDTTIQVTKEDIDIAFDLWGSIGESQQYNLPPYILELFEEDILKPYVLYRHEHKGKGLERKDILKAYFQRTSRPMDMNTFRQQVIPMLESAGLIYQQKDDIDRRKMLIHPVLNQKKLK